MRLSKDEKRITRKFLKEFLTERRDGLIEKREQVRDEINGVLRGDEKFERVDTESLKKVLFESGKDESLNESEILNEFIKMVNSGIGIMDASTKVSDDYPINPAKILYIAANKGLIDEYWGELFENKKEDYERECPACGGTGEGKYVDDEECLVCYGSGYVSSPHDKLRSTIKRWDREGKDIPKHLTVGSAMEESKLNERKVPSLEDLNDLLGKTVVVISGYGNPEGKERTGVVKMLMPGDEEGDMVVNFHDKPSRGIAVFIEEIVRVLDEPVDEKYANQERERMRQSAECQR